MIINSSYLSMTFGNKMRLVFFNITNRPSFDFIDPLQPMGCFPCRREMRAHVLLSLMALTSTCIASCHSGIFTALAKDVSSSIDDRKARKDL